MAQYTVHEVADTLIHLARGRKIDITNLKLQKLLYYAQSWNLAFGNGPLFSEEIEAWVHGPVVPSVFRKFKAFRWKTIDSAITPLNNTGLAAHLSSVLDVYGKFGASQLERLTHSEAPWKDARTGLSPDEPSSNLISKESMRAFYADLANGKT